MAVIANRRSRCRCRRGLVRAVIANRGALARVVVHGAAGAPPALDPDVATTATLPPALVPHIAGALALVVTVTPLPAVPVTNPSPLDPDEAGPRVDDDDAWGRWFLLDLDDRDWNADVAVRAHDAASTEARDRGREREATESVLECHNRILLLPGPESKLGTRRIGLRLRPIPARREAMGM
jgi:hypothetical protein